MKKLLSTIVVIACLGMTYNAYAAGALTCTRTTTPPSGLTSTKVITGCTGTTTSYYVTANSLIDILGSCSACGTGYTREAVTISNINTASSSWSAVESNCANISAMISGLYTCVAKTCTDCTSDTNWVSFAAGYQKKTTATCNAGVCTKTTAYQCAQGYYGSSTNGTSGCARCPTWTGVYSDSAKTKAVTGYSAAGITAITGCMILPGTYYDVTGTFNMGNPCTYTN
ncbi:MAG: hypothetical protein K2M34_00730 [Alphaproteobacteria bacterium]|nr:hypothetical protein [Alphaproteobacteria bacterium]